MVRLSSLSALAVAGTATTVLAQQAAPCAVVAQKAQRFAAAFPDAKAAYVPADVAQACLESVPINKAENDALINELMLYLSWQSNIVYLEAPPPGYTEGRYKLLDEIQKIQNDLSAGKYNNEYTFQADLAGAFTKAYDFHLAWRPDILDVFSFQRGNLIDTSENFALVSLSSDGSSMPKLYNFFDIKASKQQGWQASAIVKINDQDANTYVNNWAVMSPYHDADARYNRMFVNQAGLSYGDVVNEFVSGITPDGAFTTLTYENGTEFKLQNYAQVNADFSSIDSGEAFYEAFLNRGPPKTTNSKVKRTPVEEARAANPTATGYPQPVYLHSESVVGGYYLNGNGYNDVAVLGLPSFMPNGDSGATEFQDVVHNFLADAAKAGKTKLVIDLRSNGGGRVFLGYDLFKQLFPSVEPWGATQYRANDAFNVAGIAMTQQLSQFSYDDAIQDAKTSSYKGLLAAAWKSIFNYKLPVNKDGKPFNSWEDLFGPREYNGDKFTNLERYNFNDYFTDDSDMDVSGYRTRANFVSDQHFKAEDIVLLQDGGCGSTCAVFAEMMKSQARVRQVVIGGRPQEGPMQSVAGSKGAQVWDFMQVYTEAKNAYDFLADAQEQLNNTEIGALVSATRPLKRTTYGSDGSARSVINLRDNIREGDNTNTPLEFVYEAADCKLFYTPDMLLDVELVWQATVDARWNKNNKCVKNSVGDKSSLSGGAKVAGSSVAANSATRHLVSSPVALITAISAVIFSLAF